MKASATYQALLEEGAVIGQLREARRIVLMLGTNRFGEPDERTREAIESTKSLGRLEAMAGRLTEVETWDELLSE